MKRKHTRDDRVAIGELVKAATGLCAESKNDSVVALGAILAERAAMIWRGDAKPCVATPADLREFAKAWDATTPAAFSPKPRPHSKRGMT